MVDWYSNITDNTTKQICYITSNIPKVNMMHIHKKNLSKVSYITSYVVEKNYAILQPYITYVIQHVIYIYIHVYNERVIVM